MTENEFMRLCHERFFSKECNDLYPLLKYRTLTKDTLRYLWRQKTMPVRSVVLDQEYIRRLLLEDLLPENIRSAVSIAFRICLLYRRSRGSAIHYFAEVILEDIVFSKSLAMLMVDNGEHIRSYYALDRNEQNILEGPDAP